MERHEKCNWVFFFFLFFFPCFKLFVFYWIVNCLLMYSEINKSLSFFFYTLILMLFYMNKFLWMIMRLNNFVVFWWSNLIRLYITANESWSIEIYQSHLELHSMGSSFSNPDKVGKDIKLVSQITLVCKHR